MTAIKTTPDFFLNSSHIVSVFPYAARIYESRFPVLDSLLFFFDNQIDATANEVALLPPRSSSDSAERLLLIVP